jgi:hypothetical protein
MNRAAKMRDLIAELDMTLLMAKDLNRQLDEIDRILEEKHPQNQASVIARAKFESILSNLPTLLKKNGNSFQTRAHG